MFLSFLLDYKTSVSSTLCEFVYYGASVSVKDSPDLFSILISPKFSFCIASISPVRTISSIAINETMR